jgi:hypothetical protein
MSDRWIKWSGGELPCDRDQLVLVRFRHNDRETEKLKPAHRYHWHHTGSGGDIIAYKPLPAPSRQDSPHGRE